ncbi:hypothetical protein [Tropicimonas sp. IMCC6043]|uniref:hypothetical protein n=1 Tax=Tropicimonas sp. IMCC6043 TaxID=2510645 RepID=UPI00101C778D|nr:hypothetical protein [Tropicimonas sp. IMCC6043]RYH08513.1 hypothetical protein EU800_15810 [Tropicimonas sp. IMCC6043]
MQRCRLCGQPLAVRQDGDVCDGPTCRTRARIEQNYEIAARRQAKRDRFFEMSVRRAAPLFDELARRLGVEDPDTLPKVMTPYIEPPVEARSLDEVLDLASHIAKITEKAFADGEADLNLYGRFTVSFGDVEEKPRMTRDESQETPATSDEATTLEEFFERREAEAGDEPLALTATCIACGGNCCTRGLAHHAYLTPVDIAYFRHRRPDATPASVIAYYMSHLPARSIARACLYLTETGCAQPRELRSVTCNRFQCGPRREMKEQLDAQGAGMSAVVGLAIDHDRIPEETGEMIRVVTVKDGKVTVHDDLRLGALPDHGPED